MSTHLSPERHARYRWAAESIPGGRVLDAGCGAGWGTALLAESAGDAVGVDFSPAAVGEAQREHGGDNTIFREGDMRELPFADGEFDHVVCFEALTQVAEPKLALDELCRVLRRGGLLFISSPNREAYPPGNPLQLSELSSTELESLLAARLANVAVYCQQSYHASVLGVMELLAQDGPTTPIKATVRADRRSPGSELHAVAVAGDGELPPAPAHLVLGEELDYGEQQALLAEWQQRAVKAEAAAVAQGRKLRGL